MRGQKGWSWDNTVFLLNAIISQIWVCVGRGGCRLNLLKLVNLDFYQVKSI